MPLDSGVCPVCANPPHWPQLSAECPEAFHRVPFKDLGLEVKDVETKYYIGFDFAKATALRELGAMAERQNPGWTANVPRTYESARHNAAERTYIITLFHWEG